MNIWSGGSSKSHDEEDKPKHSDLPPTADPETNVYDFGVLLLEIISGKLPHSEEQGALVDWVNRIAFPSPPDPINISSFKCPFLKFLEYDRQRNTWTKSGPLHN